MTKKLNIAQGRIVDRSVLFLHLRLDMKHFRHTDKDTLQTERYSTVSLEYNFFAGYSVFVPGTVNI